MGVDDIATLLESHGEELPTEDLIHLEKQMIEEDGEMPTPEPMSTGVKVSISLRRKKKEFVT
ncbi:hypothetical protein SK128_001815 [Halocaridina rubra]|uniref:Uncharacterized protein n=1 Tax=Halocaridina rubra TaxID=373956 RepID=A0AAN8XUP3_HALRR